MCSSTLSTKHLLSTGCIDVNCVDDSGFTALHHAASFNNTTMIRLLHAHQANINVRMEDESGAAPIHVATMYGSLDAIVKLHQLGCDISAFDDDDLTPLHYAVESEDMNTVSLLLKLNANVTACGSSGAPLHIAAKKDNLEIIEVLVQNGHPADIDLRDTEDYTPLHVAAQNGCDWSAALLVSMGANVCSKTAEGQSACELATRSRCHKVIPVQIHDYTVFCDRLITACSSIVNDPLPDGRTPLDLARDLGLEKMAWNGPTHSTLQGVDCSLKTTANCYCYNKHKSYTIPTIPTIITIPNCPFLNSLLVHLCNYSCTTLTLPSITTITPLNHQTYTNYRETWWIEWPQSGTNWE